MMYHPVSFTAVIVALIGLPLVTIAVLFCVKANLKESSIMPASTMCQENDIDHLHDVLGLSLNEMVHLNTRHTFQIMMKEIVVDFVRLFVEDVLSQHYQELHMVVDNSSEPQCS